MTAPLKGIRIIEAANWLAAPSGCCILADLGADVIKVEPPTGDPFRSLSLGCYEALGLLKVVDHLLHLLKLFIKRDRASARVQERRNIRKHSQTDAC